MLFWHNIQIVFSVRSHERKCSVKNFKIIKYHLVSPVEFLFYIIFLDDLQNL